MLSDWELAELMDSIDSNDKAQLAEMLREMSSDDIAYFKGYVRGYADAAEHLQRAVMDGSLIFEAESPMQNLNGVL